MPDGGGYWGATTARTLNRAQTDYDGVSHRVRPERPVFLIAEYIWWRLTLTESRPTGGLPIKKCNMQRYFSQIEALTELGDILRFSNEVCRDQGAIRRSYHMTPQFGAPNSMLTVVYAHGYDPEWLEKYEQSEFRLSDPIPERTMEHGAMLTWDDARTKWPNTPENEEYFKAMDEAGLIHGFGLPLFGPRGRDAYASFDFGIPISQISPQQLGIVRSVPQAAHQRVCVLLDAKKTVPELSDRESEVLQWVARGKSISSIAAILGLSADTVKTYTKRIYAKLDASDRVGAIVTALKLGLVRV